MKEKEIFEQCVEKWGVLSQFDMMVEECAELIDAIQKRKRKTELTPDSYADLTVHIIEECVDVDLLIEQMKAMINVPTMWKQIRKQKIQRLKSWLINKPLASKDAVITVSGEPLPEDETPKKAKT